MTEDLTSYKWQYRYCTSSLNDSGQPTDILHDFYLPALSRATRYDRVAGYFRSSSLAAASQGYTAFLKHDGQMRLIVGADLQIQDVAAILEGNHQRLSDSLMSELEDAEDWPDDVQSGVALLGEMVASVQLEVRVAFRVNAKTCEPISVDSVEDGYVHEKWFIMADDDGNRLYGSGSMNESKTALVLNAENIDIHCDWKGAESCARVNGAEKDFLSLWENRNPHMCVMEIPDAVKKRLIHIKNLRNRPSEIDGTIVQKTVEPSPKELLKFAVLKDAPKMPGGVYIGMYSAPVEPWPHQEIVSRRLVESWPYSYMMCDEVGLGKTIEAALAIRSLVLSGRINRVLIVPPANLTGQWHRELAQKAMLPFSLSKPKPGGTGKISHTTINSAGNEETIDSNLYSPQLNIVSTGLVSRRERFEQLKKAEPFDVVLVDESHYARRQNPREGADGCAKYGNLYTSMQYGLRSKAKSLWMATATPMQIDPIEVYDLFRLTNRVGEFQEDPTLSMEYFKMLGGIVSGKKLNYQQWQMLGQSFAQIEALDPYLWNNLQHTAVTGKNRRVLANLAVQEPKKADIHQLIQPLFAASPLSRVMMRHTRALLEKYRENGELKSNLARRHVRPVCAVKFTPQEKTFNNMLEAYCTELGRQIRKYNPQTRQVMVFLLNFLQLRFASSFYAIQMTLYRRLLRVENTLKVGARTFDSQEELDEAINEMCDVDADYDEGDLSDITLDALLKDRSKADLEWEQKELTKMLLFLKGITDTPSKMQALLEELGKRQVGNRMRQTVLFTRFYDTLTSIRNFLSVRDSDMRVGIYAGGIAKFYDPRKGKDVNTSHEEIKRMFLNGDVDLLLCTDAAAEGLNLQTADLIINFDLGWNPMKIEQRIGRIDRIGQKYSDIEVINMCYLESTEEIVYGRLLSRLATANLVVGSQQISMLPVEPDEFRQLHDGEITLDDLEKRSVSKLKQQQKATASMEMSAEDLYQMYSRMSAQMRAQKYPANLDELWEALISSDYLKSCGAVLRDNGTWYLPRNEDLPEINGTISRDIVSDDIEFVTWGNPNIDLLLDKLNTKLSNMKPHIQRLEVCESGFTVVGYAVSAESGPLLVTSFEQIENINVDMNAALSNADIQSCTDELRAMAAADAAQIDAAECAENRNREVAALHRQLVTCSSVALLREMEGQGCDKFVDAIKTLESNSKAIHYAVLPFSAFEGKDALLLFPIIQNSGEIQVVVRGALFDCAVSMAKREAAGIKAKNSEKKTREVIRRLERRQEA